ncbi:MAG: DUF2335 domain-containing protein [Candidatus Acidiferrales bacterium]
MSKNKQRRLLGQQNQNPTSFQITAHAAHFSGPIPPPDILIKYNEAVPGAADRIITMAENQSKHRQGLEKTVIDANCRAQRNGSILGFIICMTAILGGMFLVYSGKSAEGLASIIAPLVGLAGVFVVGKMRQKKELDNKTKELVPSQQS